MALKIIYSDPDLVKHEVVVTLDNTDFLPDVLKAFHSALLAMTYGYVESLEAVGKNKTWSSDHWMPTTLEEIFSE